MGQSWAHERTQRSDKEGERERGDGGRVGDQQPLQRAQEAQPLRGAQQLQALHLRMQGIEYSICWQLQQNGMLMCLNPCLCLLQQHPCPLTIKFLGHVTSLASSSDTHLHMCLPGNRTGSLMLIDGGCQSLPGLHSSKKHMQRVQVRHLGEAQAGLLSCGQQAQALDVAQDLLALRRLQQVGRVHLHVFQEVARCEEALQGQAMLMMSTPLHARLE